VRGNVLYAAITSEDRVLAIDVAGSASGSAFASEYVGPAAGDISAAFDSP
jgi:hypothetical protein